MAAIRARTVPDRGSWRIVAPNAKLQARVVPQQPEQPAHAAAAADCETVCQPPRPVRLSWAKLLERMFEIDLERCPNCGGQVEIIAVILEHADGRRAVVGVVQFPAHAQGLGQPAEGLIRNIRALPPH
jgi:hypothetical protein